MRTAIPAVQFLLVFVITAATGLSVRAGDPEARTFAVSVDGKPAGTTTMTATVAADRSETMAMESQVHVRILVVNYRYAIRSTEVWKSDRLVSVDSATDDNGKKKRVRATADGTGLTVTANGRAGVVKADAVSSSGWRAPPEGAKTVTVFDVEEGTETAAHVEALGAARVRVDGREIAGKRYKLTGRGLDAEWWFDAAGRPIRQDMTCDGHRVVLELTRVGK